MCGGCGGEYACHDWCPDARDARQASRARAAVEEVREAAKGDAEALRVARTYLEMIAQPSGITSTVPPTALAREALDKIDLLGRR